MFRNNIIEPIGFIVTAVTLLFSFILFYSDNGQFLGSVYAALIAAGLAWVSYIMLRWMWLAMRE